MRRSKQAAEPAQVYDVVAMPGDRLVVIGVPLETAQDEAKRLDREAATLNTARRSSVWPQGEPFGLHGGVLTTHEVRSRSGLVI